MARAAAPPRRLRPGWPSSPSARDTGGSIRIPAACCGVTGFKPTYGLVPLDGCFPLASSFDHAGPMARDVEGCSRALEALAPGFAPTEVELDDVRVGVLWLELADPLVQARVDAAAARFQHRQRLDVPLPQGIWPAFMREVADVHRELYEEHRDSYSENVGAKIERCLAVTDADYARAVETRELYRERLLEAAAEVDLLLTPTLTCVAPRTGQDELVLRDTLTKLTFPFNASGWPALALPCGPAEDGLPASAQLAAPPGSDALVLAAGAALQRALSLD